MTPEEIQTLALLLDLERFERPGIEYGFTGDEHGRLTLRDPEGPVRRGERIEFFPPHCDPTFNLYDRVWCVRGAKVEAVWDIAAPRPVGLKRGRLRRIERTSWVR